MKKIKILYWVFTALLAAFMTMSSIPDILSTKEAVDMIATYLGFPACIIPFQGVAKLLAVVAILVPGLQRLKEWAYAGHVFDLAAATYSSIAMADPAMGLKGGWILMFVPIIVLACSYILYHTKLKAVAYAN